MRTVFAWLPAAATRARMRRIFHAFSAVFAENNLPLRRLHRIITA
jgi:hypothetical protein